MSSKAATPMLVRLPSSHRKQDALSAVLGYHPHCRVSFRREGLWAWLPEADAQELLARKQVTRARVDSNELRSVWYSGDPYRGTPPKNETCPHLPERWIELNGHIECCECGTYIKT